MHEGPKGRGGAAGAAAFVPACGTCPRDTRPGVGKSQLGSGDRVGDLNKLTAPGGCRAGLHAANEAKVAPKREVTGRARRRRGACAHTCASCRCPGAARARRCARACVHTDPQGRRHRPGGLEAGARATGSAAPTALTPAPTPPALPASPGLDRPVTFFLSPHLFLLVAGIHVAVGVAGFKLQVPQAHGQTGCVWSGRGGRRHSGEKKCERLRVPRRSQLSGRRPPPSALARLRLPPASAPRPPPQQHLKACQLGHASR